MLKAIYLKSFKKEVAACIARGKNIEKLVTIITMLTEQTPLPPKHRNHKLKGNFNGYFECHIEPDWLLIYKKTKTEIFFTKTGSHSDLF